MEKKNAFKNARALIPIGERIDHSETKEERKRRELAAAFNRMGSDRDGEAHNAFERARQLVSDLNLSFDALYRATKETLSLSEANAKLGKQLRQVLRENAKYRSMNIVYKIMLRLALLVRAGFYIGCFIGPVAIIAILFYFGFVNAIGAALLLAPIGFYDTARGLVKRSLSRIIFGSALLLTSVVGFHVAFHYDAPIVHQRQAQLIDNMNRDKELGPKTFFIDYPLSQSTLIMTVFGTKDSVKVSVDGVAAPLDVTCTKYYENSIIVAKNAVINAALPEKPDIFHRMAAASFGPCDLYAELSGLH